MEATSTNNKTFQLTENGQLIGELIYENLFSLKAAIRLSAAENYQISPVGFFGTSNTVTQNETEVANLKMNWHGQIIFSFQDGKEFVFKAKNIFQNQYIFENKEGEMLLQYVPEFQWKNFPYHYSITYNQKPEDKLFVLLGVYAANYFIVTIAGTLF